MHIWVGSARSSNFSLSFVFISIKQVAAAAAVLLKAIARAETDEENFTQLVK